MNAMQYEELCRQFVSETLGVARHKIESRRMPAPARPGEKARVRQVDLCWETETELGRYLTIADAKYRGQFKIDQDAVVSLQKVKEDVGAQKAMIITTTEFTEGAIETAKHFGIALHILRPAAEFKRLHRRDRQLMQQHLAKLAKASPARRLYQHTVVCKTFEQPKRPSRRNKAKLGDGLDDRKIAVALQKRRVVADGASGNDAIHAVPDRLARRARAAIDVGGEDMRLS